MGLGIILCAIIIFFIPLQREHKTLAIMKKMMIALLGMLTIAASGNAMSYEQARNEALFLTDKMAYELNLTDEQYEAAYEINLDYLMGVTSYDDVYGDYWERRNRDLSYILYDAQWQAYIAASYFYRPLYWSDGFWHFGIYARYPHRHYFYFGRPAFYATYRGAHAWHLHGTHGYYYNHRHHFRPEGRTHFGMHDRWNRGDFNHHHGGTTNHHGGTIGHHGGNVGNHGNTTGRHRPSDFGGPRTSSTRTTVNNNNNTHSNSSFGGRNSGSGSHSSGSLGSSHSSGSFGSSRTSGSFGNSHSNSSFGGSRSGGSFGGGRSSGSSSSSTSRGGFGGGSRSSSSHSGGSRSGGSFGSRR